MKKFFQLTAICVLAVSFVTVGCAPSEPAAETTTTESEPAGSGDADSADADSEEAETASNEAGSGSE